MQHEYDFIIRMEGASEGTVGSLDSLDLYNFNEIICGTVKKF